MNTVPRRLRATAATAVLLAIVVASGCSSDGGGRVAPRYGAPVPVDLPSPAGASRVGVASITRTGSMWYAAGSFGDAEGQHHPALWSSPDAVHWTWVETDPRTLYGEIGELYS